MKISEPAYDFIRKLVYEHSRIDLGEDKKELVSARVGKRLSKLKLADFEAYCGAQRQSDARWQDRRGWHASAVRNVANVG